MRNRFGTILLTVIVVTALLGGWLGDRVSARSPLAGNIERLLKTFTVTLAAVEQHYVHPDYTHQLIESAIRGMLRTLDPHSSLFTRVDYSRLQEEQRGSYYGLGITIRAESPGSGRVVVVEPPSIGTPAYKAGIQAGDVISKIEGKPIDDWDLNEEVIPNLKGPKGTKVNISIERAGEIEPLDLVVIRDEIPLYTIRYSFYLRPQIGYIKINKFSETTGKELEDAFKNLDEQHLKGLVLDLRDNPGGALSQALAVSDRFLEKRQLIVSTRGRAGEGREFRVREGAKFKYPMIVLINQASASASEIVAGALQDHDRALIVGETSFGKALVQTIYPLQGNLGLALTTGKYYTPSNRLIQRRYSDSFYDYYYAREQSDEKSDQKHQTGAGRSVFGGGGITPDEEIVRKAVTRLGRLLDRNNLFVEFATKLTNGEIKSDVRYWYSSQELSSYSSGDLRSLINETEITESTIKEFKIFSRSKGVEYTDASFEDSREWISNRLKQQIFLRLFGDREAFRVSLEGDSQVQRAI